MDRLALKNSAPYYVRLDNGPEFVAHTVSDWCRFNRAGSLFIDPGSPWQNAWIESFNGRLRDELFNSWRFDSLLEARVIIEDWRGDYNANRPPTAHGELTPTEFALQWTTTHQLKAAERLDHQTGPLTCSCAHANPSALVSEAVRSLFTVGTITASDSAPTATTGQSAPATAAAATRVTGLTEVRGSANWMLAPMAATAVISAPHKYIVSIWVTPFWSWLHPSRIWFGGGGRVGGGAPTVSTQKHCATAS